ncbi:MAG: DUF1294 domain-containing protein [Planctomycetota bacterium]
MIKFSIIVVWIFLASTVTAVMVWWDKRAAQNDRQRIPERHLLLASLLGGWPGHLAMSRQIRHKTAKSRYRIAFTAVAIINVLLVWFVLW